ncbi:hypothetical protein DFJ73DRAFT_804443, partial [Zopfochytrium polystomum]
LVRPPIAHKPKRWPSQRHARLFSIACTSSRDGRSSASPASSGWTSATGRSAPCGRRRQSRRLRTATSNGPSAQTIRNG